MEITSASLKEREARAMEMRERVEEKRAARMERIAEDERDDLVYLAPEYRNSVNARRARIEEKTQRENVWRARRNRECTYNVSVRKHNADSVTVVCGYSGNVRNATVLCDENSLEYATRAIGEHLAKLYADTDNAPRRVLVTLD